MREGNGWRLAALGVAVASSAPGLLLPYLSDDWANLAAAERSPWAPTPFHYVRPLYLGSFAVERALWGLAPAISHLVNLLLIVAATWLAMALVRSLTRDARLAGMAGLLFALHPYHVETAAWVAARSDLLYATLLLAAALRHEAWRRRERGLPAGSLLLFAAALLSKEAAVGYPALLVVLEVARCRGLPPRALALRSLVPHLALAGIVFGLVRPLVLEGRHGLDLLARFGPPWGAKLVLYATASWLPLHTEVLEASPRWWALAGVAGIAGVSVLLWRRGRGGLLLASAAAFLALLVPSLVSFQERYLFLPGVAAAVTTAAVLLAAPGAARWLGWGIVLLAWPASTVQHWVAWAHAGQASTALVRQLVEASLDPAAGSLTVVNLPHRIHGAPVTGDLHAAVRLSGGRSIPVRPLTLIDYPRPDSPALAGPVSCRPGAGAAVLLSVPHGLFGRFVHAPRGGAAHGITRRGDVVGVDLPPASPSAPAFVWSRGSLEPVCLHGGAQIGGARPGTYRPFRRRTRTTRVAARAGLHGRARSRRKRFRSQPIHHHCSHHGGLLVRSCG